MTGVGRAHRPERGWVVATVAAAAAVIAPVAVVASSALTPTTDVWRHLWDTRLPGMLATTVALLAAVGVGTLVLGGGLAWLVTAYRFPGRSVFAWLLVLPLAMPAYILGFVLLSLLSYAGPVQTAWRAVFGAEAWFPEVRSLAGAAAALTLTLYPYVYLLARAALREQAAPTFEAARALGHGRLAAARRVVVPLARPSLAAGLTLVAMETLTDFATVQYFNVDTVSVGVYRVWKGMMDRPAAAELAALVLAFALAAVAVERLLRGRARYFQHGGGGRGVDPARLGGWRAAAASGVCTVVLAAAFAAPVARLVTWLPSGVGPAGWSDPRFVSFLANSLLLAGLTAAACVAVALVVGHSARLGGGRLPRTAAQLTAVGYLVPGPVVAIGALLVLAGIDRAVTAAGLGGGGGAILVTGSFAGLLYAYVVRFAALATTSVDASLAKIPPTMTDSARVLGASTRRVLTRVHVPLLRSGMTVAAVLVLIDAMKELPIVLLLRPFGFDTLPVWVWQLATAARWEAAGLPALVIVAAGLLPVALLVRAGGQTAARPPQTAPPPQDAPALEVSR